MIVVLAIAAAELTKLGLLSVGLGAIAITVGALGMVLGNRSYQGASDAAHRREKFAYLVGGLLIGLGALIQLIAAFRRT
jgi:hypothetical protein